MGANSLVCPEKINGSEAAELCHGQACPLRFFALTTHSTSLNVDSDYTCFGLLVVYAVPL